jgi:molybdopterin-containing oxidoreductase family iron-sulfur binding subunit
VELSKRGVLKLIGLALLGVIARPVLGALSRFKVAGATQRAAGFTGKRWAMAVNLKSCTGCGDCIDACHRTHNVPSIGNPKDEVKWLWTLRYEQVFPEQKGEFIKKELKGLPTLVLCNHCDNPPCAQVCPVVAIWKREDGIVMQDYHRCIGCRYCMLACPYDAISFNWRDPDPFIPEVNPDFPTRRPGVVERCNFCQERVDKVLRPACVETCKENALVFGDLEDGESEVRRLLESHYSFRRKPELGTKPKVFYIA